MTKHKLVIVGSGEFAELCYEYFTHDSIYDVAAFSGERNFITRDQLFNLPVVPFEELEYIYPPDEYKAFVAVSYTGLNRLRERLYHQAKAKGYELLSYVSSHACIGRNSTMGDNCLVLEGSAIQPFVRIGSNVVVGNGSSIGHNAVVKDHCFLSFHAVVLGKAEIGENCFLGGNCTIFDRRKVGSSCIIGAGCSITADIPSHTVVRSAACVMTALDMERAKSFG